MQPRHEAQGVSKCLAVKLFPHFSFFSYRMFDASHLNLIESSVFVSLICKSPLSYWSAVAFLLCPSGKEHRCSNGSYIVHFIIYQCLLEVNRIKNSTRPTKPLSFQTAVKSLNGTTEVPSLTQNTYIAWNFEFLNDSSLVQWNVEVMYMETSEWEEVSEVRIEIFEKRIMSFNNI